MSLFRICAAELACPLGLFIFGAAAVSFAGDQSTGSSTAVLVVSTRGHLAAAERRVFQRLIAYLEPILHGEALRRKIASRISRSAGPIRFGHSVISRIERGRREFIEGNYRGAVRLLSDALDFMRTRLATVAADQSYRASRKQALLFLAQAYLRLGERARAIGVMEEMLRSFGEADLPGARYSPDLIQFHQKVRAELANRPRSKLLLKSRPSGLAAFVNERYVGKTPLRRSRMLAGSYRVHTQRDGVAGRVHPVVLSGSSKEINIDFAFDQAIATEDLIGLSLATSEVAASDALGYARRIGRLLQLKAMVLLSLSQEDGDTRVIG